MKNRKLVTWTLLGTLLAALLVSAPATLAANLSGGTYTYVFNGQEASVTFDPIKVKEKLLLPVEVFDRFGIAVAAGQGETVTLKKFAVQAQLTLGSPIYALNGTEENLEVAPLKLNGRLFLPADLLKQFGVDLTQDGTFLIMRDQTQGMGPVTELPAEEFEALKELRTVAAEVRADSNIVLNAEFTMLNEQLLQAANLDLSFGARARLHGLLRTNTLVLVKLSNTSFKSGALSTAGLYLVDSNRNQYEVVSAADIGKGALTVKLAPGADRVGVLVFPRIASGAGPLTLYYENNNSALGYLPAP